MMGLEIDVYDWQQMASCVCVICHICRLKGEKNGREHGWINKRGRGGRGGIEAGAPRSLQHECRRSTVEDGSDIKDFSATAWRAVSSRSTARCRTKERMSMGARGSERAEAV